MWDVSLAGIWLLTISILDIKSRRVPIWLLALGGVLSLAAIGRCGNAKEYFAVMKGMLPGIFLLTVAFFTGKAGYGDGVALLLLGMMSEGKGALIFGVSLFMAAIVSMSLLIFQKVNRNTRIPYLPFLAAAWLLTVGL